VFDSSEKSHQGQIVEKVKALCFQRGSLLIFDKQDMVVASSKALPSGGSESWRGSLGPEGKSGTGHYPAHPKVTALPLNWP